MGSDALKLSPTGGFTSTVASFPQAVTLANTGDYVDVSFRFRMDTALKTTGSIRFGLYDAMGTPAVDDGGLAPAGSASDDQGYYAVLSAQAAGGHGLREESGGTDRIMAGTDFALLAGNASLAGVTDTAAHTAALRITKLAAGVNVAWSYDGVTYISHDDATPQTLTYDEFAFQSSEANKASFLDDVVVTTNVASPVAAVPLPASSVGGVMLLTGLAAAQGLRRRLAPSRA
jgi:hypothetical protein